VMMTASSHKKTASVLFLLSLISVCSISSPPFANLCLWFARTQGVYTFELIPQCHSVKGEGAFARACNSWLPDTFNDFIADMSVLITLAWCRQKTTAALIWCCQWHPLDPNNMLFFCDFVKSIITTFSMSCYCFSFLLRWCLGRARVGRLCSFFKQRGTSDMANSGS
jgi:hypothetical protein